MSTPATSEGGDLPHSNLSSPKASPKSAPPPATRALCTVSEASPADASLSVLGGDVELGSRAFTQTTSYVRATAVRGGPYSLQPDAVTVAVGQAVRFSWTRAEERVARLLDDGTSVDTSDGAVGGDCAFGPGGDDRTGADGSPSRASSPLPASPVAADIMKLPNSPSSSSIDGRGQNACQQPQQCQPQYSYTVVFPATGTFRFAMCDRGGRITSDVCCVQVTAQDGAAVRAVGKGAAFAALFFTIVAGLVALVVFFVRRAAFLSRSVDKEQDQHQYEGLQHVEDLLVVHTLPWVAVALILVVAAGSIRIVKCCWPTPITAFQQGYSARTHTSIARSSYAVLLLAGVLSMAAWWLMLNGAGGYTALFRSLNFAVGDTLNEAIGVANNVEFLIDHGSELVGNVTIPDSARDLLNEVRSTATTIRVWTDNGESIIQGLYRALSVAAFLSMQFVMYAVASGVAATQSRSPRMNRGVAWCMTLCLAGALVSTGILSLVDAVLRETYDKSVRFNARVLTAAELQQATGVAKDSPLIQLFGVCSDGGALSVGFLVQVLGNATSSWNELAASSDLDLPLPNASATSVDEISEYLDYFSTQLDVVARRLEADPAAFAEFIPNFNERTAPLLLAATAVGKSILGIVDCRLLRTTLSTVLPVLKRDVLDTMRLQLYVSYALIGVLAVAAMVVAFAAYIFARPLKFFHEPATRRWFRYRVSHRAHLRLVQRRGLGGDDPLWVSPSMCVKPSILSGLHRSCQITDILVFLQAVMLVILHVAKPESRLPWQLQLVAFTCATAPLPAVPINSLPCVPVRQALRVVGLVVTAAAAGVAAWYASVASRDSADCVAELQTYRREGGRSINASYALAGMVNDTAPPTNTSSGTADTMSPSDDRVLYPFTERCALDRVVRDLELATYSGIIGFVALLSAITSAVMLLFPRFTPTHVLFDAREKQEEDRNEAAAERHRAARRRELLLVALATVLGVSVTAAVIVVVVLNVVGAAPGSDASAFRIPPSATTGCNGYASNCDRRVNEVIWPTTHNAFSSLKRGYVAPNQFYDIDAQLESGVRGFMIDLWPDAAAPGRPYLCHKFCALGAAPLVDDLRTVAEFLQRNRREVVIFHIEQYVPSANISQAWADAGLLNLTWTPPAAAPSPLHDDFQWPTLMELIDADTRVLVFNDEALGSARNPRPGFPWLMYMWDYWVETGFAVTDPRDFGCAFGRGSEADNPAAEARKAIVLNHFLTAPLPAPFLASQANDPGSVVGHFGGCKELWRRTPTMIGLDFWTIAEPLRAIDSLTRALPAATPQTRS